MSRLSEERMEELVEICTKSMGYGSRCLYTDWIEFARIVEREAYKAGQERMRERAAMEAACQWMKDECFVYTITDGIRNLETEEPK